jgi:glycosyltransferase involved in cell wall biosynthesis
MKILTYTTLFPNNVLPNHGIFIKNRMFNFAKLYSCKLKVVAPVPYFPSINVLPKWYRFSQVKNYEQIEEVDIFHPRYLITPKVGMAFYGISMFLSTYPSVRRIHKQFGFDLIDAHYIYPDCFAAVLIGKLLKIPVIVSARGTDINLFPKFYLINKMIRFILQNASGIIAVSKSLKDEMVKQEITPCKVSVIGNGVNIERFYPLDKNIARKKLELPEYRPIILSVGHLIEGKGFHHLINAIRILRKIQKDIFLIIIGEGECRKQLEKQIYDLELIDNVRLVGAVSHEKLNLWYNSCDVFCLASSREGWPNVLLEALACGKPVVATKVGGVPEIICAEDYGLLVEEQSGDALAAAIDTALRNEWDYTKMIHYAAQNNWEEVSRRILKVFETCLNRRT